MKTRREATGRSVTMPAALPLAAVAHEGHGAHGWLQGALQPLLSLDHLLAGLLVLVVGTAAFALLGRAWACRREGTAQDRTG